MSSIRLYLRDSLAEELNSAFTPLEVKTIEVWTTDKGLEFVEHSLPPDDIIKWIDQILSADSSMDYQEYPLDMHIEWQKTVPFAKDTFFYLSKAFNISLEYLHLFYENRYTPLHVSLPVSKNDCTRFVLQSPSFESFATLALSYNANLNQTTGYLGYNDVETNRLLLGFLKEGLADISHPLLIPALFFGTWINFLTQENRQQSRRIQDIKKVTSQLSNPNFDSFEKFDDAHAIIVKTHDIVHNGMGAFLTGTATNLEYALGKVPEMVGTSGMTTIEDSHRDIQALFFAWKTSLSCTLDTRTRIRERLTLQLQVLYNMMQRGDSKRTQELADDSRRIAKATLNDSSEMKDLTAATKKIAQDTRLDSSAMKTIAIVTMLFLPGTAIATILSMGSFFQANDSGKIMVTTQFWIYWILTIPVTIAVFISWWFKTHTDRRAIVSQGSVEQIVIRSSESSQGSSFERFSSVGTLRNNAVSQGEGIQLQELMATVGEMANEVHGASSSVPQTA